MSDDRKPPAVNAGRRARRAVDAYRSARRLAASATRPENRAAPSPPRASQGAPRYEPPPYREREDGELGYGDRRYGDRRYGERGYGYDSRDYRERRSSGPVKFGLLFGFGFAAGTALFRVILILIFYGALIGLGLYFYGKLFGGF